MTSQTEDAQTDIIVRAKVKGTVGTTERGRAVARLSGPINLHVRPPARQTRLAEIALTDAPAANPADITIDAARAGLGDADLPDAPGRELHHPSVNPPRHRSRHVQKRPLSDGAPEHVQKLS